MHGRCHTYLFQFDLINYKILGEEYKFYKCLLHSCLLVLSLIDLYQQSVKVYLSSFKSYILFLFLKLQTRILPLLWALVPFYNLLVFIGRSISPMSSPQAKELPINSCLWLCI